MSIPALDGRTSTGLVEDAAQLEFVFPAAREVPGQPQFSWVLDFTGGGKYAGVVMSQARMREIELVVNPFSAMESEVQMMAFGTGSWVDLLVSADADAGAVEIGGRADACFRKFNSQMPMSPERYTSIYVSQLLLLFVGLGC